MGGVVGALAPAPSPPPFIPTHHTHLPHCSLPHPNRPPTSAFTPASSRGAAASTSTFARVGASSPAAVFRPECVWGGGVREEVGAFAHAFEHKHPQARVRVRLGLAGGSKRASALTQCRHVALGLLLPPQQPVAERRGYSLQLGVAVLVHQQAQAVCMVGGLNEG